jgi:hypothetical protein
MDNVEKIAIYCDYHGFYHEAKHTEPDHWLVRRDWFELYKAALATTENMRQYFEAEYQEHVPCEK